MKDPEDPTGRRRRRRADAILILVILVIALAALAFVIRRQRVETGPRAEVVVKVGREETGRYPLDEDRTVEIESADGGTNTLVIENGAASVTDANCPDKLCVYQAEIRYNGQTIVCLPHEVVVSVESDEEAEADGVAG